MNCKRIFSILILLLLGTFLVACSSGNSEDDPESEGSTPVPDTEAPGVPSSLDANAVSTSQIDLSWSASTDNVGVEGYRIYRDGTLIATTVNTNYSDTGLNAETRYAYRISAYDEANNESQVSEEIAVTTQPGSEPPSAWQPPIGIPMPWINPTIARPDSPIDWSNEVDGYYYIDYNVGSDTNAYGTPSNPRRTLPSVIPAGSYVEINGDYHRTIGGAIWIRAEGTAGDWIAGVSGPVWIVGANFNNRMEFSGNIVVVAGSYIYLENAYVHDGARLQLGSYQEGNQVDHILVRNVEIEGQGSADGNGAMLSAVGSSAEPVGDIIYFNSNIHSTGPLDSETDVDARGIAVGKYSSNVWVLENKWYDSSAGLQVDGGTGNQQFTHHVYIGKNEAYNVAQAAVAVKRAVDVVISQNTIHDIIDTPWSPSKGIGFQYAPDRVWILFNEIYNCNIGIRGGSDDSNSIKEGVYIIGNLIRDIIIEGTSIYGSESGLAININNGLSPRHIVNNTIYNVERAIVNSYYNSELMMENNIISQISEFDIFFEEGYSTSLNSDITNTLFNSPAKISWGDGVNRDLSDFQLTYSKCANCIQADPLFTDSLNNDFSLQSTSSAIDSGIVSDVYQMFEDLYGLDIRVDINGFVRPQGNGWDLGAFEYGI